MAWCLGWFCLWRKASWSGSTPLMIRGAYRCFWAEKLLLLFDFFCFLLFLDVVFFLLLFFFGFHFFRHSNHAVRLFCGWDKRFSQLSKTGREKFICQACLPLSSEGFSMERFD